ncbi:MAG: hypothetical protein WBW74_19555 [Xanthobacteraceae bacterium]
MAEKSSRALCDDDRICLGDPLQARREVRSLADDAALLRIPRSDEVANHDHPGRNADTHLQRRAGRGCELGDCRDEREPGLHGALGIILVGVGIAEIGEHAVAHVLGDEPAVALDQRRAAAMIGADDPSHVLRIEPLRHRSRAHEVAEHHGELPPLGIIRVRTRGRSAWHGRRRAESRYRPEQALAVPEWNAEFFEVDLCQFGQDIRVDRAIVESAFILAKPQASEPIPHIHGRVPTAHLSHSSRTSVSRAPVPASRA